MNETQTPVRSVTERIVSSGLVRAISLDLIGVVALVLIGVSVHCFAPQLVYGYAGVLLLAIWWSVGQTRARAAKEPR